MTLEDKFYPDDGTLLNKFDNFMIKSAGKVGEAYQHVTGNSYKDLVRKSYKASLVLSGTALTTTNIQAIWDIGHLWRSMNNPDCTTPLEEEIQSERYGGNKKQGRINRAFSTAATSFFIGMSYMVMKYFVPNYTEEESFKKYIWAPGLLTYTASSAISTFAEYLSKSILPKPPKKKVSEKLTEKMKETFERIKEGLAPRREPVPVKNYSALESYVK